MTEKVLIWYITGTWFCVDKKKQKKLKHSITRFLPIFNFQWLKQKAKSMEEHFG